MQNRADKPWKVTAEKKKGGTRFGEVTGDPLNISEEK